MTSDPSRHRIDNAPRSVLTRIRTTIAATCAIAIGGIAALLVGVSNEVSADADADGGTSTSTPLEGATSSSDTTSSSGDTTSSSDTTSGSTESGTSTPTAESSVSADDSDSEPVGGSNGS